MKRPSVSVTGATGFVGWHVAETFANAGWRVQAIVRPGNRRPLPERIDIHEAALEPDAIARALAGTTLVVHCAGIVRAPSETAFAAVNIEGTRAVVHGANRAGTRLTLISSLAAAGPGTPSCPRRESDASQPVNAYGRSKLAGEDVVRAEARIPWTIVRPSAVYGPRDRGFLPLFRAAKRGVFMLPTPAETAFSLIEVRDLAAAIVAASTREQTREATIFAAHPVAQTSAEIVSALATIYGRRARARTIPRVLLRSAAALGDLMWKFDRKFVIDGSRYAELSAAGFVCAVDELRERAGYVAPTSLADGFRETALWYQQRGWV